MRKPCLSLRYEGLAFVGEGMPPEGTLGWAPGWAAPAPGCSTSLRARGQVLSPHPSAMSCLRRAALPASPGSLAGEGQQRLAGLAGFVG